MFHLRSAARRLRLNARTWSVSHGDGGRRRAGLEVRGQSSFSEVEMEENRESVASSGDRSENASGFGNACKTIVEMSVSESERRLGRVVTISGSGRSARGRWERKEAVNERK